MNEPIQIVKDLLIRAARHGVSALGVLLTSKGIISIDKVESVNAALTEIAVGTAFFVGALVWSKFSDKFLKQK